MGGLHDDRDGEAGLAHPLQYPHAVEAGHHEIEHDGIDRGRLGRRQQGDCGVAGIHHHRFIAAFLHHGFDEATLHGVIIGDQNGGSHGIPLAMRLSVSNRGTLADDA